MGLGNTLRSYCFIRVRVCVRSMLIMCFVTEDGTFSIDHSGLAPTDSMEGSQSGSAIVYVSSISQHCYGTHHGAPMTDTSSFGLAMGICIIAVHLDVQSIPLFHHSFSYRSMHAFTSRCSHASVTALLHGYLVGQIGKSSLLLLLLGDADLRCACKHHRVGTDKCSQQSLTCPYKQNVSSVRVLAPISRDLLIRPCFLYVRLLREDVGRCTFASHCAPAFLSDACHHRTLHHCWLRSTGEGESFLPLLLLLSCSPLPPFKVRFSLLTPRF